MEQHKTGAEISTPHKYNIFSIYRAPISNVTPEKEINIEGVHNLIISNKYQEITSQLRCEMTKNEMTKLKKEKLDYVTFSGVFSQRNEGSLITTSGYYTIDLDDIPPIRHNSIFQRLMEDMELVPQLIFTSPSGRGIKIIVRYDLSFLGTDTKRHLLWHALNSYFASKYSDLLVPNKKKDFIDATKDISRACFLCHDTNAYLNVSDHILGQEFLNNYQPLESSKTQFPKVKSNINNNALQQLAERYLAKSENHTPELLSFIGAAIKKKEKKEEVLTYILNKVAIAGTSSKSDKESISKFAEDIFERYSDDTEIVQLSPLVFGYRLLYFRYNSGIKKYIPQSLCRVSIQHILKSAGFAKRRIGSDFIPIRKEGCFISEVTCEDVINYFRAYLEAITEDYSFHYDGESYCIPIANINEIYLRDSHNIFNEKWLQNLPLFEDPILKDTAEEMFFFFQNKLVIVSREGIRTEAWDNKSGFCIWKDQLIQHNFVYTAEHPSSHWATFLNNIMNNDEKRYFSMCTAIGYLLHNYFSASEGQAVILYDESITNPGNPMGGTGKGLIFNGIKLVRNTAKIDGKHFEPNNRFRWEQVTPSTQVVWLDDVKPDFDFTNLHSNLTDGWTIERKYHSQFTIAPKDSPKTGVTSNSIIQGGGTTNIRRQFIMELSDYYSSKIIRGDEKPIQETHGCIFFSNDWDELEWNKFFTSMVVCALLYLNNGLVSFQGINIDLNRLKQSTEEDFVSWALEQDFQQGIKYETKKHYNEYVSLYYGETHQIGQRKFTAYLKEFACFKGWHFKTVQSNSISYVVF